MVTGARPFAGETPASVIGSILKDEPSPISTRQPLAPHALDHLVATCLAKDPDHRWQSAADVGRQLEWIRRSPQPLVVPSPTRVRWLGGVAAAGMVAALAMAVPTVRYFRSVPTLEADAPELHLQVLTPPTTDPISMALSPDGRRLTFVATSDGSTRLWLRPFDAVTAQPLPGTEGASYPFWSPDSRAIGFFAEGKLKRIDIGGGQPQTLANAAGSRGGAWNRDDVILFGVSAAGLQRVPASGGEVVKVTRPGPLQTNHRFPQFLPDGRRFLFFSQGAGETQGVFLGGLDSPETTRLTASDTAAALHAPWLRAVHAPGIARSATVRRLGQYAQWRPRDGRRIRLVGTAPSASAHSPYQMQVSSRSARADPAVDNSPGSTAVARRRVLSAPRTGTVCSIRRCRVTASAWRPTARC